MELLGTALFLWFSANRIRGRWPRGGTWSANWLCVLKRHTAAVVTVSRASPWRKPQMVRQCLKQQHGLLCLRSQHTHIGVVLLQKLCDGLQEGHKELSRLAKHPARLSDENTQENSTDLKLFLSCTISYGEIFWNLRTQKKR